jgi:diacylglycerol kinase family enzyme
VGFDAYVVARNQNLKRYGSIAYLLGMLRCIFSYRLPVLRIKAGDTIIETPVYLVIAGIGRYCGGGMMLTPGANQTGDKLYLTVIKDFNKLDVIRYTHRLYSGSFIHLSKVQVIEATQVDIEVITATQPVYMETDGDILGQRPFTISLLPGALTFVTP